MHKFYSFQNAHNILAFLPYRLEINFEASVVKNRPKCPARNVTSPQTNDCDDNRESVRLRNGENVKRYRNAEQKFLASLPQICNRKYGNGNRECLTVGIRRNAVNATKRWRKWCGDDNGDFSDDTASVLHGVTSFLTLLLQFRPVMSHKQCN